MSQYAEIRITYFDDDDHFYRIDAWKTDDENEIGSVIGFIHESGDYVLIDADDYANEMVMSVIKDTLKDINLANKGTDESKISVPKTAALEHINAAKNELEKLTNMLTKRT